MFDGFHYSQIFNSIVAVNTIDMVNLFTMFQRLNERVSHKAMNQFVFPTCISVTTIT